MSRSVLLASAPAPVLIEYRDLIRCNARIDQLFEWQGWEEPTGDGASEVLFVHDGRLGCYRSARGAEPRHRGCAGTPFPFGDFLITLETAIRKDGRGTRIESALEAFFSPHRDERRQSLWSGRIALSTVPDGSRAELEHGSAAGVLDTPALLRRLGGCHDCRSDPTCWQVVLGTALLDVALGR
jgi:hypothetical protein